MEELSDFLKKCSTCKHMVIDEDVGDMCCDMSDYDNSTCQFIELELGFDGITECDIYEEKEQK